MTPLLLLLLTQTPAELPALFSHRAAVQVDADEGALVVLPLDEAVLSRADRDLADVRLVDASGRVVPFTVQTRRYAPTRSNTRLTLRAASRRELPAEGNTPHRFEETLTLELPEGSPPSQLAFVVSSSQFVRALSLEVLDAKEGSLLRQQTSLFRFPGGERVAVELPELPARAALLRVTLLGQDDGFLSPRVEASWAPRAEPQLTLTWPLNAEPFREGNHTVVRVARPAGVVPVRLELTTRTPWFSRTVEVRGAGSSWGSGRVFRQPGVAPIELLSIPVTPDGSLEVEIDLADEDSPPLEALQLAWVVERPHLVFTAPRGATTLYLGGKRVSPARFDTSGLLMELPSNVGVATLGAVEENPAWAPVTPLAHLRRPGAPLSLSPFQFMAAVPGVKEGEVTRVRLTPAHLAGLSSSSFSDLRLVDAQGRQWPWLLETELVRAPVSMTVEPPSSPGETVWRFEARGAVESFELVPAQGTPFFSRSATLRFAAEGEKPRQVWAGYLSFDPGPRHVESVLSIPVLGVKGKGVFTLTWSDGGDAPLTGVAVEALLRSPQLTALLEPGDYRVVYGQPGLEAPRYDLVRAEAVVRELKSTSRIAEAPQANPEYVAPSLLERSGGATRWAFWGVLVLAVLGLSVFVVRMARSEPAP